MPTILEQALGAPGTVIQRVFKSDNQRRLYTGGTAVWRSDYTALNLSITPSRTNSELRVRVHLNFHGEYGAVLVRLLRNGVVDPALNGSGGAYNCFAHTRIDAPQGDNEFNTGLGSLDVPVSHDGTLQEFALEFFVQYTGRFTVNRDGAGTSDTNQGTHSPTLISTFCVEEVAAPY